MRIFICLLLLLGSCLAVNASEQDKYLETLDRVLADISQAVQQKEQQIDGLKATLAASRTLEDEYNARMELYRAYQTYSLDSALVYLKESLRLAHRLGNNERIIDTYLSQAFLYCYAGMYKDAHDILSRQDVTGCSAWLRRSYFHLKLTIYDYLAGSALDARLAADYREQVQTSRDSALHYASEDRILAAERLSAKGDYAQAARMLSEGQADGLLTREAGICYYVLSEIYERQNNLPLQKKYLAMAAAADLHNAIREYIALRKLAILLYQEGDVERAYRYIHRCIEDANACNARQRILEISQVLPLIDAAYADKENARKQRLKQTLAWISILSVSLLVSLCWAGWQVRALRLARRRQCETNARLESAYGEQARLNNELKHLNDELHQLNDELRRANTEQARLNDKLSESNQIKEEYIMRFMNLCSDYLSKMEEYRKELNKIAAQRNFDLLYNAVKSTRFINKEIEAFYRDFDEAFLHLFPHFVDGFNQLLMPQERIVLKDGERLNTELRIYALLRLGISDSTCVSNFLRCSFSTVYNYRTKMRNKAVDRDSFERNVLQID